jgi:NADPH2:quinone reductase
MRAVVMGEFGGPEVLQIRELPEPEPGTGEVAIDVAYAGVNFADVSARRNGYRVDALPFRPGLEVSGRIRAIGPDVTGLSVGQEVAALISSGGYAEVATAPAATVYALPEGVGLRVGATLPSVLPTAYALVYEVGRLRAGDSVLVHGAAGGVGTALGQTARAAGASVVYGVVSRPDKVAYALEHGYDEVFVGEDFVPAVQKATEGRGLDLIFDPVGGENWRRSLESLALFGRLVSYGGAGGEAPWTVSQGDLMPGGRTVSAFSILGLAATAPDLLREIAGKAFLLAVDGTVRLPITAEFALAEAPEAHRLMESRTSTGKLLLRA